MPPTPSSRLRAATSRWPLFCSLGRRHASNEGGNVVRRHTARDNRSPKWDAIERRMEVRRRHEAMERFQARRDKANSPPELMSAESFVAHQTAIGDALRKSRASYQPDLRRPRGPVRSPSAVREVGVGSRDVIPRPLMQTSRETQRRRKTAIKDGTKPEVKDQRKPKVKNQRKPEVKDSIDPWPEQFQLEVKNAGSPQVEQQLLRKSERRRKPNHKDPNARLLEQSRTRSEHEDVPSFKPFTPELANQSVPLQHRPLSEQLFPEETKRQEELQRAARDVPRLPLELFSPMREGPPPPESSLQQLDRKPWLIQPKYLLELESQRPVETLLVLQNAGRNLTEEDFRRLVPRGKHLEGWTQTKGDIIKVIPMRDMTTLAQLNDYYILFSSPVSAFHYQGYVSNVHHIARTNTPKTPFSVIPPPPGYMVQGMDVHAAIQSFSLIPSAQELVLRQLKPPLTESLRALVEHRGYPALVNRPDKMPYEVRLTLDGPQITPLTIRHILMQTGRERGLSWAWGEDLNLPVTVWDPKWSKKPADGGRAGDSSTDEMYAWEDVPATSDKPTPRTPNPVFIVGFEQEAAAQSFVQHWQGRPMEPASGGLAIEGEMPPVANVELLW